MPFKPSQQRQTQDGVELFPSVIQSPLRLQTETHASAEFALAMQQAGIGADQAAAPIYDHYSTNIQHFVDVVRQQRAIAGAAQYQRSLNLPGLDIGYRANQGDETLHMRASPEAVPEIASQGKIDPLLGGYVFLYTFAFNPTPPPFSYFWVEIGGNQIPVDTFKLNSLGDIVFDASLPVAPKAVDSFDYWQAQFIGGGWTFPFGSFITWSDQGGNGFNGYGGVVRGGGGRVVAVLPDLAGHPEFTPSKVAPFKWCEFGFNPITDPSHVFVGGYTTVTPPPPPDSSQDVVFAVNGEHLATIAFPLTQAGAFRTLLIEFGPDAVRQHSALDRFQPAGVKLLNKIIPPRKDLHIPIYVYLFLLRTLFQPRVDLTVKIPGGLPNNSGKNVFTCSSDFAWSFIAEFYDRKDKRLVVVSPHFAEPTILTNDNSLAWGITIDYKAQTFSPAAMSLSATQPVTIDFHNPNIQQQAQ